MRFNMNSIGLSTTTHHHPTPHPSSFSTEHSKALVAQLDALPTGDQEVAGLTPAGSATFIHGDSIMKYFLLSFSPFC